jgi:peptidoglycan/xylan/chitin deacetylase (PgdA/CDA1 family)
VEPLLSASEGAVEINTSGWHVVIPTPSEIAHGAILGSMVVLNFHAIGRPKRKLADGEDEVCVERQQFVEILDLVADRDDVYLTFDDGNCSDVTEALPELTRRQLRAQFFICPARFGTPEFVDEDHVRELRRAGMSLGSHGMDHVRWRRLERSAMDREIVQAKRVLEDALQAPVDTAACPFGAYDRRTLRALRAAGFTRVYTSDGGPASAKDWLIARNTVRRWDSAESIERLLNGSSESASLVQRAKRWIKQWR